jgi:hypothetical protein
MNQTIKNFWAHRRQNAWIIIEIALVAVLSFHFLDGFVVTAYDTYLCRPAGDFERDHLLVGVVGFYNHAKPIEHPVVLPNGFTETDTTRLSPEERFALQAIANLYTIRDRVRALPEVQYAGLMDGYAGVGHYRHCNYCAETDTTRQCGAYEETFLLHEQFFETLGITPVEGSPAADVLSNDCPTDGAVITRSMALALFGTDQAVGRRLVEYDYSDPALAQGRKVAARYTVAAVVEDYRFRPNERYSYIILVPRTTLASTNAKMFIRLHPEADAAAFVTKIQTKETQQEMQVGNYGLALAMPYADYFNNNSRSDVGTELSVMGTFIALLLLNVILGTLGTFWLQIRKRTEDIGIMRSFGAKRRNIFWMLWREAALLTFIAAVIGQIIWLQFAMNVGLAHGFTMSGTGRETDWVNTFWLHYLIVCAIQYVLLLIIVTLGMVVPTFRAMYKRPVEALHHE